MNCTRTGNLLHDDIAALLGDESGDLIIDAVYDIKEYFMATRCPPLPMPKGKTEQKIGHNSPCPCGSGKKYKKCCGK